MKSLRLSDRRLLLGSGITLLSLVALLVALVAIISAAGGDEPDLPSEGSLEEIIEGDSAAEFNGDDEPARDGEDDSESSPPQGPLPVRIGIPDIHIDAPVTTLGVDADLIPEVPQRGDQVAWYNFSATPGQNDNAVFSGHVDWQTRDGDPIPGVFYRLRELNIGDTVTVTLEDDQVLEYRVTGNVATDYQDENVVRSMGPTVRDVITLITCGGSWVPDPSRDNGGSYSHRIIVRAERVQSSAASVSG